MWALWASLKVFTSELIRCRVEKVLGQCAMRSAWMIARLSPIVRKPRSCRRRWRIFFGWCKQNRAGRSNTAFRGSATRGEPSNIMYIILFGTVMDPNPIPPDSQVPGKALEFGTTLLLLLFTVGRRSNAMQRSTTTAGCIVVIYICSAFVCIVIQFR